MRPTLLAAAFLSLAAGAPAAAETVVVDRVAAVVNGEVITLQELVAAAGEDLREAKGEKESAAALHRAFENMVADRLLSAQAASVGVEISEAQIDQAIAEVKKNNGFDDAQLEAALAAQGLTIPAYRQQIRRQFETFNVLRYKVRSRVKVAEEDLRNYYQRHRAEFQGEEQVHARHIFLPLPVNASKQEEAQARAEGEKILQRLKTGEDFATVARQASKGPGADDGGDLGWLSRGAIQKQLEDVAFGLKAGEFSGLVRAGPGLHILKAEARRGGDARPFEEVRQEIEDRMTSEQLETYRQQYIAELRRDAVIEVKIPELKD